MYGNLSRVMAQGLLLSTRIEGIDWDDEGTNPENSSYPDDWETVATYHHLSRKAAFVPLCSMGQFYVSTQDSERNYLTFSGYLHTADAWLSWGLTTTWKSPRSNLFVKISTGLIDPREGAEEHWFQEVYTMLRSISMIYEQNEPIHVFTP